MLSSMLTLLFTTCCFKMNLFELFCKCILKLLSNSPFVMKIFFVVLLSHYFCKKHAKDHPWRKEKILTSYWQKIWAYNSFPFYHNALLGPMFVILLIAVLDWKGLNQQTLGPWYALWYNFGKLRESYSLAKLN